MPQWSDPGQAGRVSSVVLGLMSLVWVANAWRRWSIHESVLRLAIDACFFVAIAALAVIGWRPRRW